MRFSDTSEPDHYGTGCATDCIDGCGWPALPCGRLLRDCARDAGPVVTVADADRAKMRAGAAIYDGERTAP